MGNVIIHEGGSATVRDAECVFSPDFNALSTKTVIKHFKPISKENLTTLPDYKNEVIVLQTLNKHRHALSFAVPKLIEHAINQDRANETDPVAFIKMTKISHSLSGTNIKLATEQQRIQHAKFAARALAELHSLELSIDEQKALTCSPIDFDISWLQNGPAFKASPDRVEKLCQELQKMTDDPVFIHNDFHHKNLFSKEYGTDITGICDFCCAGMGPKELDFYPFLHDPVIEKSFLDAYQSASHKTINYNNLDVIREMVALTRPKAEIPTQKNNPTSRQK